MKSERQQPLLRHPEVTRIINGELFQLRRQAIETSMVSTRSLGDYADYLGFDPEVVQGKVILDVGSGPATFAEEAEQLGAEVVSLDPKPGTECERMTDEERKRLWDRVLAGKIVPGIAQELPFEDNSFDLVTALMSVPNYLPDVESEKQLALLEMARVLKQGGEARIFPVLQVPYTHISISETDLWLLHSRGYRTRIEPASSVADITKKCPVFAPVASLMTGFDRLIIEKP